MAKHLIQICSSKRASTKWQQRQVGGRWAEWVLGMAAIVLLITAPSKATEYQVRSGDVLELAVINAPELNQRVPVEINGNATFPLIGELKVDGLSLGQIRKDVRTLLENSIYRPCSGATGPNGGTIQPNHVSLRVAVYRPVYVTGDVAKPGEITFRPGLTVRQAISIAGGYDPLGERRSGPAKKPSPIILNGELSMVRLAIAETEARIWRLRAALGEATKLEPSKPELVAPDQSARIFALEKAHLESFKADQEIERAHLEGAIRQSESRVKALLQQAEREKASAQIDEQNSQRVSQLFEKGLVGAERVSQVRRLVLLSTTRALQTQVAVEQEKQTTQEYVSRLRRLDSSSRVKLRDELTQEHAKANSLRLRMATLKNRLLTSSWIDANSKSILLRRREKQTRVLENEDVKLLPGDVVEVALLPD